MKPSRYAAAAALAALLLGSCEIAAEDAAEAPATTAVAERGPRGGVERRVDDAPVTVAPTVPDSPSVVPDDDVTPTTVAPEDGDAAEVRRFRERGRRRSTTSSPTTTGATAPTTTAPRSSAAPSTTAAPAPAPTPTAAPVTTTAAPATPTPTTTAGTSVASLPSSAVVNGRRVAALWPFTSDSPWNTPLGSGASYASASSGRVSTLRSSNPRGWPSVINIDHYSQQVYRTTNADPVENVFVHTSSEAPHYNFTAQYRIPSWATPAVGTDSNMNIVQPDGRTLDETWIMEGGPGHWSAEYWVRTDLYSNGLQGGTRAYGGSAIAGLVRDWELEQGRIDHGIAVALRPEQLRNGPVWPAYREDGGGTDTGPYSGGTNGIAMGSMLAIPPSVDLSTQGLSPAGLAIARAFQNYGGYVVDKSDSTIIAMVEPSTESQYRPRSGDADIIQRLLTIVENNSSSNPGGPGSRRVATAPPLQ